MSSSELSWHWRAFADLTVHQLYQILRLRQQVFVVEQHCCYDDIDNCDHNSMVVDGADQLLAYSRVFAPGVRYEQASIGRVIIAQTARGTGLGHRLMERSIAYCEQHFDGASILIDGQSHLTGFYQQHGFHVVGDERLVDGIPHVQMVRQ
jgi:ElaA protein